MHALFVHQNFPAQFRHVAPRLASDYGWRCTFATTNDRVAAPHGVEKVIYHVATAAAPGEHMCVGRFRTNVGHALGVYKAMKRRPELRPDLIVAHSGFGSSLFLPYLYDAPIINFFEYFFRPVGQDLDYRPDDVVTESDLLRWRVLNSMVLHDLENCDRGWSPSVYQRALFPAEYQNKIEVIPEGINTELWAVRKGAERQLPDGTVVPEGTRIVTYVSRGFEKMRGFDVFMKAAKLVYEQYADVLFVVVGSDRICYSVGHERGGHRSFRERVLAEGDYDLSKFQFTGRLTQEDLSPPTRCGGWGRG